MKTATKLWDICKGSTEEFIRHHSTGGIIVWNASHSLANSSHHVTQTRDQFLNNKIVIVKSAKENTKKKNKQPSLLVKEYGLPKGHIEKNETLLDATYREIYEESGIRREQIQLLDKLGVIVKPEKSDREVHFYLFCMKQELYSSSSSDSESTDVQDQDLSREQEPPVLVPHASHEIEEARWCSIRDLLDGKYVFKEEAKTFLAKHLDQCHSMYNDFLQQSHQQQGRDF